MYFVTREAFVTGDRPYMLPKGSWLNSEKVIQHSMLLQAMVGFVGMSSALMRQTISAETGSFTMLLSAARSYRPAQA